MKKLLLWSFLMSLLVGVSSGAGVFVFRFVLNWAHTPIPIQEEKILDFPRGTSLTKLSQDLELQGLTSHAMLFSLWVRLKDDYSKFQAGKYRFTSAVSPIELIATFRRGDIYQPVVLEYVIPEGFTLTKIASRLSAKGIGDKKTILGLAHDKTFLKGLDIDSSSLEGYIYPATYRFVKLPSPEEALSKMVKTFWKKLPKDYEKRVNEMGLSLTEAVTFASLIELESSIEEEKPLISEVIWRRLNQQMALAIDASIIYGIEDYDGDIKWKHLKDESNPYNTRVHRGLPPTPIGSPSRSSLLAVLKPTDFGYLYYVLDVDSDGKHHFSKTLAEHNKYVRKLVKKSRGDYNDPQK